MKSVLYIGGFELPDKNAAAQRVMANAKMLREMGYEVSFIGVSKDMANAPKEVDGFASNPVKYPTNVKEWVRQIISFADTKEILNRKVDYVVLYNFPSIASLRILWACHKKGIKVFHDLTEWESSIGWSFREIIRKLDIFVRMHCAVPKMDGLITISRYLYDYYKKSTFCVMVPPLVNLSDAKWNRERTLTAGDPVRLVYAGTAGFGNKDRLDFVLDALKGKRGIALTVIGMTKAEYEGGYGKVVPEDVDVEFKGRLPHLEAVRIVQESDFQILVRESNLKNNAGFPTKLVESFACCTPLVANLTSNIGDYLKDGVNGIVVPDLASLPQVFDRIAQLPKAEILSMKGACRKMDSFDYRNYKEELTKLLNRNEQANHKGLH